MGIEKILSEEAVQAHRNEQNVKKVLYSVYEVSYPCIKGAALREIANMRIDKGERAKILRLKADTLAHDLFFSSFGESYEHSDIVESGYGNTPAFLYELSKECMECPWGFMLIYVERGRIKHECTPEPLSVLLYRDASLAIDLCEHAYHSDYGFNKNEYVNAALSNLRLSLLS